MIELLFALSFLIFPGLVLLRPGSHGGLFGIVALGFGFSLALVPPFLGVLTVLTGSINHVHVVAVTVLMLGGLLRTVRSRKEYGVILTRREMWVGIVAVAYFVFLWSDFLKYPIFPRTPSEDFANHLRISTEYISGTKNPIMDDYPPGVRFLIGLSLLIGGEPLVTMRVTMAVVASFQIFMIYLIGTKFLGHRNALLAPVIYLLLGSHWLIALFSGGLYANFVGDSLVMLLIYLLIEEVEKPSRTSKFLILLASASLLITHYIYWLFVFSLWVSSLSGLAAGFSSLKLRRYLTVLLIVLIPGVAVLLLRPDRVLGLLNLYSASGAGAGTLIYGESLLRQFLNQFAPFLLYISTGLGSDLLLLLVLVALFSTLYRAFRVEARSWMPFVYLWFLSAWVLSPYNAYAWRFSNYAQVPLVFILANFAEMVGGSVFSRLSLLHRFRLGPVLKVAIVVASAAFIIYNSPLLRSLADVTSKPLAEAAGQRDLYESFQWVIKNTPPEATLLSITNWRYPYQEVLTGRDTLVPRITSPEIVLSFARNPGRPIEYVLVDRHLYPREYGRFVEQKDFEAVWENGSIVIFQKKSVLG